MRAAVRSVSARSVSVRRAGSALTIGGGGNELSKAIALLRSVGGRMYLPGLTSRVASDGSGGSPVAGDVIGWLPDRVTGGLGPELLTNGDFSNGATGWSPGPNWAVANGVASCDGSTTNYLQKANVFTANKTYRVEYQIVSIASGSIRARASTSSLGSPRTSAGVYVEYLTPNESGGILNFMPAAGTVASIDNISVREVIALTQATTGFKPRLIREPILGPELVVNGSGDNTAGWNGFYGGVVSSSDGVFVVTCNGSDQYSGLERPVTLVAGKEYQLSCNAVDVSLSNSCYVFVSNSPAGAPPRSLTIGPITTSGVKTAKFTALQNSNYVSFNAGAGGLTVGETIRISNISVREILGYTERYSLEFDGVDDVLYANTAIPFAQGLMLCVALSPQAVVPSGGAPQIYVTCRARSGSPSIGISQEYNAAGNKIVCQISDGSRSQWASLAHPPLSGWHVWTVLLANDRLQLRKNGVLVSDNSAAGILADGAIDFINVGSNRLDTPYNFANARIQAPVVASGITTLAEIQQIERAVAAAAGITL